MQTQTIFPQDLFDVLADEAIEDLCKTGMDHEEIFQILEDFLGAEFAKRFDKKSRSSNPETDKCGNDPERSKGR